MAPSRVNKSDPNSYEYLERLGTGCFGTVYKVKHTKSGELCAMKILLRSQLDDGGIMKYAMAERNVMSYVRHPYIVPLRFAFQTKKQFALVMKFCPGGDMSGLLKREGILPEPMARHYAAEILLAIGHLHDRKILHRDLKPENIVFDEERHAMLTDFGLSKESVERGSASNESFLGSIAFIAPEILERSGHCFSVDVYGLGALLYTMLVGKSPFFNPNKDKLWEDIRTAPLRVPKQVKEEASDFIVQTMRRLPCDRLGAVRTADAQDHPFFAPMSFPALMRREVPVPKFAHEAVADDARVDCEAAGQCRTGHPLTAFVTSDDNCACNLCCAQQPRGSTMHSCRPCDYDICADCHAMQGSAKAAAKRSRALRRSIFGSRLPRALQCLLPGPVDHWDYAAGGTVLESPVDSTKGSLARCTSATSTSTSASSPPSSPFASSTNAASSPSTPAGASTGSSSPSRRRLKLDDGSGNLG